MYNCAGQKMDRSKLIDVICGLINDCAADMKSEDKFVCVTASSKVFALCQALLVILNI